MRHYGSLSQTARHTTNAPKFRTWLAALSFLGATTAIAAQIPSGLCVNGKCEPGNSADGTLPVKWHPGHYAMAGRHDQYKLSVKLKDPEFQGIQAYFDWADLEPEYGKYDLSSIENVLQKAQANNLRLVIKIRYKSFNRWARKGTCAPQYIHDINGVGNPGASSGRTKCVARIYMPEVLERLNALIAVLGKRFDSEPFVEAVVMEETAGPDSTGPGYSLDKYMEALSSTLQAMRKAFPTTVILQQANWLPGNDKVSDAAMGELFKQGESLGVGFSGPDLMPGKKTTSTKLYPSYHSKIPLGMDTQSTYRRGYSVTEAFDYAVKDPKGLRLNYVFWNYGKDAPWDWDKIVATIRKHDAQVYSQCPTTLTCQK